MIVKQNGKCRIVTEKGKILAEFGEDGTAEVPDKLGARLLKLGYAAADKSAAKTEDQAVSLFDSELENGGASDDTGGETEAETS